MIYSDTKIQNTDNGSSQRDAQLFVKSKLPSIYKVVKLGQKSHFFKLIEKTFLLLNDLQFCCLPLQYRNLCVKHYIDFESKKKLNEMEREHEEWLENEAIYIEDAVGNLERLSTREKELLPFIRQSVFSAVYEEQAALKKHNAFAPFLSICNAEGNKNESYFEYIQKREKLLTDKKLGSNRRKIDRFDQFAKEELTKKGVNPAKLKTQEQALVDKTIAAVCEAMRKVTLEDTPTTRDYFLFDLAQTKLTVIKDASALEQLDETRKATELYTAKDLALETWKTYQKNEDKIFEELCGFKLDRMSPQLRDFRSTVRAITYRLIHEEQLKAKVDHYLYATFPYFYDYVQMHKEYLANFEHSSSDDENQSQLEAFKTDLRSTIDKLLKQQYVEVHIEDYLLQFFTLLPTPHNKSSEYLRRAKGALTESAKQIDTLIIVLHILLCHLEKDKMKVAAYKTLLELCKKRADFTDDFPFISICNKKGELNEDYWIDKLNAKAKKNDERPLEDNCDLKAHTDYDIIRINTAPAQAMDDGKTDRTNLRKNGSVTPAFCKAVLQHVKMFSEDLYQKFESANPNNTPADTQEDRMLSIAQAIMSSSNIRTEEKVIFLQHHYFDTLALTNNARGDTKRLLDKINIQVFTSGTTLLFNNGTSERRKSQTPGTPQEASLRQSGDQLLGKAPSASRPVQVRKSNPETDNGRTMLKRSVNPMDLLVTKRKSSFSFEVADQSLDATKFDDDCVAFQKELDHIRAKIKHLDPSDINPAYEDIVAYISNYSIPLNLLGQQLNTFGSMLQHFAHGLQAEETARLNKLAEAILHGDPLASSPGRGDRKGGSFRSPRRATLSSSPPSFTKSRSFSIHERQTPSGVFATSIPALRLSCSPASAPPVPTEPQYIQDAQPHIPKMDPDKFIETSQLLLLMQRCVQDVAKLIRDDITLATPVPKAMRTVEADTDEFLL